MVKYTTTFQLEHTGAVGVALVNDNDIAIPNVKILSYSQTSFMTPPTDQRQDMLGTITSTTPVQVSELSATREYYTLFFDCSVGTVYRLKVRATWTSLWEVNIVETKRHGQR
jgi:hypothetical protein